MVLLVKLSIAFPSSPGCSILPLRYFRFIMKHPRQNATIKKSFLWLSRPNNSVFHKFQGMCKRRVSTFFKLVIAVEFLTGYPEMCNDVNRSQQTKSHQICATNTKYLRKLSKSRTLLLNSYSFLIDKRNTSIRRVKFG